jgi:hypothetical protein
MTLAEPSHGHCNAVLELPIWHPAEKLPGLGDAGEVVLDVAAQRRPEFGLGPDPEFALERKFRRRAPGE